MNAAHCSPKISAEVCECTCQTALPGPNQPGIALRAGELEPLEEPSADVPVEVGPHLVLDKLVRQQQFRHRRLLPRDRLSGHACSQTSMSGYTCHQTAYILVA